VFLWGWGVMNSTAIKEAAAVRYPRDKIFGVWWSGAEPDVLPAGADAIGYNSITLQHSSGKTALHGDVEKYVYGKGNGAGSKDEIGTVLYNRGLINAVLVVEAIRTAQGKYGKKPITGEQMRWGIENLNLTAERIKEIGLDGMMQPLKVSCKDHEGVRRARIHQWNGKDWVFVSDWIEADDSVLEPMVEEAAANYAKQKGIKPVTCKN
jgi:branched-chain amino acid transport system substrate-binding protein